MANRSRSKQSQHDTIVRAAETYYRQAGHRVWINPGSQRNQAWNGRYIDVIAVADGNSDNAWVIEVETSDSVVDAEAVAQWRSYDNAFTPTWYLAVPAASRRLTAGLLRKYGINHCEILCWVLSADGTPVFDRLPGNLPEVSELFG